MDKPIFELKKVFSVKDYLDCYTPFLTEERTRKEVAFIEQTLRLTKNMKILDLCCGHGRISNSLAERGYDITGFDITKGFLKIAKKEAKKKKLKVAYVYGDMKRLPWKNRFDIILNIFTSFGYADDKTNLRILKNAAQALRKNGRFFIEHTNRDYILKNYLPYNVSETNGKYLINGNKFDVATSRNYTQRMLVKDGKIKKMRFFVRMYTFTELKTLLETVGLKVIKVFGDYDLNAKFTLDSRRIIIISKKFN